MFQIKIDKENFLERFIIPNLKVGDAPVQLICDKNHIKSVVLKDQNRCIFFNKVAVLESNFEGILNVSSLQLFKNVIKQIEGMEVIINVESNHIKILSGKTTYKIFLLEDRFISQKRLDETLFENLMKEIKIQFVLENFQYKELQGKRNILIGDVKIYFSSVDGKLVVLMGDRDKSYSDEILQEYPVSVDIPQQFIMDSYFFDALSVKDEHIAIKTDGEKIAIVQVGIKKYIFPLLKK